MASQAAIDTALLTLWNAVRYMQATYRQPRGQAEEDAIDILRNASRRIVYGDKGVA